jgi:hypothetical protein
MQLNLENVSLKHGGMLLVHPIRVYSSTMIFTLNFQWASFKSLNKYRKTKKNLKVIFDIETNSRDSNNSS